MLSFLTDTTFVGNSLSFVVIALGIIMGIISLLDIIKCLGIINDKNNMYRFLSREKAKLALVRNLYWFGISVALITLGYLGVIALICLWLVSYAKTRLAISQNANKGSKS